MTMLIRGGAIHTMTAQGTLTGDVLIEDGRIAAVGPDLRLPDGASPCTLSARGMHILPGLIDAHVQYTPELNHALCRRALAAGVTAALVWPEREGRCTLLNGGDAATSDVWLLRPEACTDAQLRARLMHLVAEGFRPACEVDDLQACQRVLHLAGEAGVRMILVHLRGCDGLESALSAADCDIVLGVARGPGGAPWGLAARLAAQGKAVCITSNHPEARLKHLLLCAALCVGEGMAPAQALQAVTTAPAALLGLLDAGRIIPGGRADLVLYDGDPTQPSACHVLTIHGGQICH